MTPDEARSEAEARTRYRIVFACGGYINVNQPPTDERCTTYTSPHQGHTRPVHPDHPELRMQCLMNCPCTRKESGRKYKRGWFCNPDGTMKSPQTGFIVTCKIQQVIDTSDVTRPS